MQQITNECPYCDNLLKIKQMQCCQCQAVIEAEFPSQRLGNLPSEHQRFIEMFVLAAGNLKEIAKLTGVSYPTVRSRLNKIIESLRNEISKDVATQGTLLDAVRPIETKVKRTPNSADADAAGKLIKSI